MTIPRDCWHWATVCVRVGGVALHTYSHPNKLQNFFVDSVPATVRQWTCTWKCLPRKRHELAWRDGRDGRDLMEGDDDATVITANVVIIIISSSSSNNNNIFCALQWLCYSSQPANEVAVIYTAVMRRMLESNLRMFRCIVQRPSDVFFKRSNFDDSFFSPGDASPKYRQRRQPSLIFSTANSIGQEK